MYATQRSWKTYALGAAVVGALLSSTGCGLVSAGDAANFTPTPSDAPTLSDTPTLSDAPSPSDTPSPTGSTRSGGADKDGGGEATTTACTSANISITAADEPQDEVKHLFLAATNTGDKDCVLYYYPNVRFGVDDAVDRVGVMESEPQAVVAIGPGEKAYAGMLLWRVDEEVDTVESLIVGLQGRVPNTDAGKPLEVALPDETNFLNVGPNPLVTYWNSDADTVKDFMFRAGGS
ncbi:DUF4232 domain-containing protein [Actinopolymorpha alba]|uniref:DUF4232 domain-containing protein n=1 Tax=Actinopolymorpha alba TaxID=533267 RepID=UPI0003689A47|nr:DUF4232 domain-containing protein [Actinopolymorpha alba]